MDFEITTNELLEQGLNQKQADELLYFVNSELNNCTTAAEVWEELTKNPLFISYPFTIQLFFFSLIYPNWHEHPELAPAWTPTTDIIANANITKFMAKQHIANIESLREWATNNIEDFWCASLKALDIKFKKQPKNIVKLAAGIETPEWLPDAKLNIADSCFKAAPETVAIIYQNENKQLVKLTYGELNQLSNRIANSLVQLGYKQTDAIAIAMPMNHYAVAIYLGIIKMGGVVVSIADSFSAQEMAARLRIANAKGIFTQDLITWGGKTLPLFEKVKDAFAPRAIVLPYQHQIEITLRDEDIAWNNFLVANNTFASIACDPMQACNILFSSGTTADPKAIPWNHTTPIKAASDAYLHQNIQAGDVLAWPTNLGWMMGPWLVFAAFINNASIALFTDAPRDRQFGEFVQNAKVSMLGVVPTLVGTWRQSKCMEGLNWQTIKLFSSTGECSNPEDMLYLMSLAGYKPVIEYCGGTEIGGAYITSTVIQQNYPSVFTTPAIGINFTIIDDNGKETKVGAVAIIPPSIGLSTSLLNADHHKIYFADMPSTADGKVLRRHGDQIKSLTENHYMILGRVDDSMNLGGIKVSAAEIERTLSGVNDIAEVAAIAVTPQDHGPSQLVIYAATQHDLNKDNILKDMQKRINRELNPLFKIHDVVFVSELPKTASNKIMRRVLRDKYIENR